MITAMVFQAITFGIGIYSFTFWVLPWTEEFSVGRSQVMTAYIAMQIVMGLLSPFAGRALDSLSIRLLVSAGAACLAIALIAMSRATALWQIGVIYGLLVPAGLVLAGPLSAQTLAAKWFSARRGLAIGIVTIGTSMGGFLMPPLVTSLQADFGWRTANVILALLVLVAIVPAVWLVVRNSPEDKGVEPEPEPTGTATPDPLPVAGWTTGKILTTPIFWIMVCAFTPMAIAFGAAQQNLAPYAADQGFTIQASSYLMSLMALVMIGAKVFFGAMADRWSHRTLFMTAIGCLTISLTLLQGSPSYQQLLVMSALLGFSAGAFLPMMGAIVSRWFGAASFGQVMGLVGPFTTLAAIGPWIAGYVRDTSGSYDGAWLGLTATLIVAAIATLMLGRRPPASKPSPGS